MPQLNVKRARVLAKAERRGWESDFETLRRVYDRLIKEGPTPVYDQLVLEQPVLSLKTVPDPNQVTEEDILFAYKFGAGAARMRYRPTLPDAGRMKPSSPPLDIRPRDA